MNTRVRIAMIRLAERIEHNHEYANRIGVAVEMVSKRVNETKKVSAENVPNAKMKCEDE